MIGAVYPGQTYPAQGYPALRDRTPAYLYVVGVGIAGPRGQSATVAGPTATAVTLTGPTAIDVHIHP